MRLSTSARGRSISSDHPPDAAQLSSALAAQAPPRVGWGALIVAGAALWLAAGQKLSVSLGEREEKSLGRRLRAPLVLAAAGLAAWWFGLFMI